MTTASKNFTLSQVGNVLSTSANGVITSINTANYSANLGPVGNVTITGGSNGQVLSTNGNGVLSWAAPPSSSGPAFSVENTAGTLNWTPGTYPVFTSTQSPGTVEFDTGSYFNTTTGRYTPLVAGYYLFSAAIVVTATNNPLSYVVVDINKNGGLSQRLIETNGSTNAETGSGAVIVAMNGTTDYISVTYSFGQGGAGAGGRAKGKLSGVWIRPL